MLPALTLLQVRRRDGPRRLSSWRPRSSKSRPGAITCPFVVNDSIEVALECDADGVHVEPGGHRKGVRAMIGPDKILGTLGQHGGETAVAARWQGLHRRRRAVFGTTTKKDAKSLTVRRGPYLRRVVDIPVGGHRRHHADNSPPAQGAGWMAWPWSPLSLPSPILARPPPICAPWPRSWWRPMDKGFCIFDMDGTLVDSMGYWRRLGRDYLEQRGVSPTAEQLAPPSAP